MNTRPNRFKTPQREAVSVDEWVQQGREPDRAEEPAAKAPKVKQARLTIDLPQELHMRFKAACALKRTRMVDEVTRFIEDWTQKNS